MRKWSDWDGGKNSFEKRIPIHITIDSRTKVGEEVSWKLKENIDPEPKLAPHMKLLAKVAEYITRKCFERVEKRTK